MVLEGSLISEAQSTPAMCGPVPPVSSAEASPRPMPCPAGTFSSLPEQTTSSACQACPPGFYCKEAGLQAPSGQCQQVREAVRP